MSTALLVFFPQGDYSPTHLSRASFDNGYHALAISLVRVDHIFQLCVLHATG